MNFNDALRALAKGYIVRQPGREPGLKLMLHAIPIHTSGLVTPDYATEVRDNWVMCRVIVCVGDKFERPTAFTAKEMAANNWEICEVMKLVIVVWLSALLPIFMVMWEGSGFWACVRVLIMLSLIGASIAFLPGCAALPVPLSPQNEQYNSDAAEGTWLVLDGIDTYQTMHSYGKCREGDPFAARIYGTDTPRPSRVLAFNVVLALAHTMVSSWLDDEVASHEAADLAHPELPGTVGPWYAGRIVWHVASIAGSTAAVLNNIAQGCK